MSEDKLDLSAILSMAQKLQGDVTRMQEELERVQCEGTAGGGMVSVTVNGKYELTALRIDPQVVDREDIPMLQDLIVAAVNQALAKVRDVARAEMSKLAGGLPIPGMPPII